MSNEFAKPSVGEGEQGRREERGRGVGAEGTDMDRERQTEWNTPGYDWLQRPISPSFITTSPITEQKETYLYFYT